MSHTALKVKISLKENGHHKYPDFNTLAIVQTSGADWSHYIDNAGLGWHYDKTSGHKESSIDSPFGEQWGVMVVPVAFADQAVLAFSSECERISEADLTTFWDTKAHAHEPDNIRNDGVMEALTNTLDLMEKTEAEAADIVTIKAQIKNALDPNHPEQGISPNNRKTWALHQKETGIVIVDA